MSTKPPFSESPLRTDKEIEAHLEALEQKLQKTIEYKNAHMNQGEIVSRVQRDKGFGPIGGEKQKYGIIAELRGHGTTEVIRGERYRVVLNALDIHIPNAGWWFDFNDLKLAPLLSD